MTSVGYLCGESFHLMKKKLAVVQMCELEGGLNSGFISYSASMFLSSATEWTVMHVLPLSSRAELSGLDVSTACSKKSRRSLPFDAPFITFTKSSSRQECKKFIVYLMAFDF